MTRFTLSGDLPVSLLAGGVRLFPGPRTSNWVTPSTLHLTGDWEVLDIQPAHVALRCDRHDFVVWLSSGAQTYLLEAS